MGHFRITHMSSPLGSGDRQTGSWPFKIPNLFPKLVLSKKAGLMSKKAAQGKDTRIVLIPTVPILT